MNLVALSPALTETAIKGALIESLPYPVNYANPFTSLAYFLCISSLQPPHEVGIIINFFSHKRKGSFWGVKIWHLPLWNQNSNPGLPEHKHFTVMP